VKLLQRFHHSVTFPNRVCQTSQNEGLQRSIVPAGRVSAGSRLLTFITLWLAQKQPRAIFHRDLKRGSEVAVVGDPDQRIDGRRIIGVPGFKMSGKRPLRISDRLILGP
jgi:hypothetical protein